MEASAVAATVLMYKVLSVVRSWLFKQGFVARVKAFVQLFWCKSCMNYILQPRSSMFLI